MNDAYTFDMDEKNTFPADKRRFFTAKFATSSRKQALSETKARALQHDHAFLASHYDSAEEELQHLLTILKQNDHDREDMWLYCYYCCIILSVYYSEKHYNSPAQAKKYQELAEDIEQYYSTHQWPAKKISSWKTQLIADLESMLSTPWHVSKLRNWTGLSNIYRIILTFARLTAQQFFVVMQDKHWLTTLSKMLNVPLNLDDLNKNINAPTPTFRMLSVGLFLARLMMNTGMVLKHTLFPTEHEKNVPMSERFYREVKKRYAVMLNDIVWAIVNGLTNYADFFKISPTLANGLLVTFLLFDFSLIAWRLHEAERQYTTTRTRYQRDKKVAQEKLEQLLREGASQQEIQAQYMRVKTIDEQLEQLDMQMHVKRAEFGANLVAASLLVLGFSASLLVTAPALICMSYLVIVIGSSLYLSAEKYGIYEKHRHQQNLDKAFNKDSSVSQKEAKKAWNDFVESMVFNTGMSLLIMGALAVSWQAALLLVVLSVGYRCYQKYAPLPATDKNVPEATIEVDEELNLDDETERTDYALTI
jgi:hypothetical protein